MISSRKEPRKGLSSDEANALTELNQHTSPLLRLPAEIRTSIFKYAYTAQFIAVYSHPELKFHIYNVVLEDLPPHKRSRVINLNPLHKMLASTTTCRQFHAETRLLPLLQNDLRVESDRVCLLGPIVPRAQQHLVQQLVVGLESPPFYQREIDALIAWLPATGVKKVVVETWAWSRQGQRLAWEQYSIDDVKEAAVKAGWGNRVEILVDEQLARHWGSGG